MALSEQYPGKVRLIDDSCLIKLIKSPLMISPKSGNRPDLPP